MDSPVRKALKRNDYQRHKLFRKMKRLREARRKQEMQVAEKELKRKLRRPRFDDGSDDKTYKNVAPQYRSDNSVANKPGYIIFADPETNTAIWKDAKTGRKREITLPENFWVDSNVPEMMFLTIQSPDLGLVNDSGTVQYSTPNLTPFNDWKWQDTDRPELNARLRLAQYMQNAPARDIDKVMTGYLAAGIAPVAMNAAPGILTMSDAIGNSAAGQLATKILTNPIGKSMLYSTAGATGADIAAKAVTGKTFEEWGEQDLDLPWYLSGFVNPGGYLAPTQSVYNRYLNNLSRSTRSVLNQRQNDFNLKLSQNTASITPEQWTAAQDAAIARGDMAEAQRLRDLHFMVNTPGNVVVKEGKPTHNYHGTQDEFNTFDINSFGRTDIGDRGRGFYFSENKDISRGYGPIIKDVYLYAKTPYKGFKKEKYLGRGKSKDEVVQYLTKLHRKGLEDDVKYMINQQKSGSHSPMYDDLGITKDTSEQEIRNLVNKAYNHEDVIPYEVGNLDEADVFLSPYENVVYKPNQIKSADAVTYDNNGVRIPLGERDNFEMNDIRYSPGSTNYTFTLSLYLTLLGLKKYLSGDRSVAEHMVASKYGNQGSLYDKYPQSALNELTNTVIPRLKANRPWMSDREIDNLVLQNLRYGIYPAEMFDDAGLGDALGVHFRSNDGIAIRAGYGGTSERHVIPHEVRHRIDDALPSTELEDKVLADAYDNNFLEVNSHFGGKQYDASVERVTTNSDARAQLLGNVHLEKTPPHLQNKIIDKSSDELIFKAVENANEYGRVFIKRLRRRGLLTHEKAELFREAMKVVPVALPFAVAAYNTGQYNSGKDIHIKPSKRGTFTAAAKKHGMGVQEYARKVLKAPKGRYSSAMRKKANFARNASRWNK